MWYFKLPVDGGVTTGECSTDGRSGGEIGQISPVGLKTEVTTSCFVVDRIRNMTAVEIIHA